ncbi:MAG: InlB B-repeat-containing protein [Clostridia bacterium]|nr:InlB B-repeat-containing protein [Clostridia bacterium]
MKKKSAIATVLACVLALGVLSFAACGKTYTVSFDCAGGGQIASQTVGEGGKAEKPADPVREGFVFGGWYLGDTPYSFDSAVTADIVLRAKWDTKYVKVTFKSEGENDEVKSVAYDTAVEKPDDPKRENYIFDGWYNGDEKFDFSATVKQDVVLTAKWLSENDLNAAIAMALNADYSNYTSVRTVTETEDDNTVSYTTTYYRTAEAAHNVTVPVSVIDPERYIVYDASGSLLAGYYKDGGEWKKSNLVSFDGIVLSMKTSMLSADDFGYVDGKYFVYDEGFTAVEYALFGTMGNYKSLYAEIADGKISALGGELTNSYSGSTITFYQTFTAVGTTKIEKPNNLPAVEVAITAKDKEYTEGDTLDEKDLLALFAVSADGRNVTVTKDMIDFGTLNVSAPAVAGVYTLTLSYTDWNGQTHTETAAITVNEKQTTSETFAEIFAKDYTNATIALSGTGTTSYTAGPFSRNGDLYYFENVNYKEYVKVLSATTFKRARIKKSDNTVSSSTSWQRLPRIDLIFSLDASLFAETEQNVYVLTGSDSLDSATAAKLNSIFKAVELTNTYVVITDSPDAYPYSVTVTVTGNYVTKIEYSYYSRTASTTAKPTLKTAVLELSEIGTTAIIDTSEVDGYLQ